MREIYTCAVESETAAAIFFIPTLIQTVFITLARKSLYLEQKLICFSIYQMVRCYSFGDTICLRCANSQA